jgi:acyl carrier protein
MRKIVPSTEEVLSFVLERVKARAPKGANQVDMAQSLVAAGLIDSFSFLELVGEVEEKFGVAIDLGAYDFDEISTVQGLCNAVGAKA